MILWSSLGVLWWHITFVEFIYIYGVFIIFMFAKWLYFMIRTITRQYYAFLVAMLVFKKMIIWSIHSRFWACLKKSLLCTLSTLMLLQVLCPSIVGDLYLSWSTHVILIERKKTFIYVCLLEREGEYFKFLLLIVLYA